MSDFLTLEDVNTVSYSNQGFYWHEIDIHNLPEDVDFTDIKYDFCKISFSSTGTTWQGRSYQYKYTVEIINSNYKGLWRVYNENNSYIVPTGHHDGNTIYFYLNEKISKIKLFMVCISNPESIDWDEDCTITPDYFKLNLKELNTSQRLYIENMYNHRNGTRYVNLNKGYNFISENILSMLCKGYVYVDLVKSDFQFNTSQTLKIGQINRVALGTLADYKPNGDMIGEYTPNITVEYKGETIPVEYDSDDYYFDLDLTRVSEPSKIKFKVNIEANDVINHTETNVTLDCDYETINNLTGLTNLFTNGGIGRLGANITLTSDLTISNNNVLLIGNNKTINGNQSHGIIVNTDKIFKAENTIFNEMERGILQKTSSTVELTGCTFTNCKGYTESSMGSCICCEIDQDSLENPNDYTTILTDCTFSNNTGAMILHGGELKVTGAVMNITNSSMLSPSNPVFLYQTDGTAEITGSTFTINIEEPVETDLMFAPSIFTVGETATINGLTHREYQNNNITSFLTNNHSEINLTYPYDLIGADVTLTASNGYCHSVSGVDYLFKTNVTLTRSG